MSYCLTNHRYHGSYAKDNVGGNYFLFYIFSWIENNKRDLIQKKVTFMPVPFKELLKLADV